MRSPTPFGSRSGRLWEGYLAAQEALAWDNAKAAKAASRALAEALADIDTSMLGGRGPLEAWDRERANLRAAIDRMTEADDLEPLRAGFALLSEEMPVIIETFAPEIGGESLPDALPDGLRRSRRRLAPDRGASRETRTSGRLCSAASMRSSESPSPSIPQAEEHDHD